jgi:hypothetical protein
VHLKLIEPKSMLRGLFSGWGPHKYGSGAHRVDVGEATANRLPSLEVIERIDVVGNPEASSIRITAAGRAMLASA